MIVAASDYICANDRRFYFCSPNNPQRAHNAIAQDGHRWVDGFHHTFEGYHGVACT